jgi:hypothetical protein
MSPFLNEGDRSVVILPINTPNGGRTAWPRQGDPISGFLGVASRAKPQQVPLDNEDVSYAQIRQQGRTMGTDFGKAVRVMPPPVQQDTYLDNAVGDTIRYIKENFGSDPLLKAYQGALDTLEESNRRWKEYYEEEARLQSIFEGED